MGDVAEAQGIRAESDYFKTHCSPVLDSISTLEKDILAADCTGYSDLCSQIIVACGLGCEIEPDDAERLKLAAERGLK